MSDSMLACMVLALACLGTAGTADAASRYPTGGSWAPAIAQAARSAGIDPALLWAVVATESGFDPAAVGPATAGGQQAFGLMQLMPGTATMLGVDRADPGQNLWGGAWYLSRLLQRYRGDVVLALAAYYAGPGAVDAAGGLPRGVRTVAYVRDVLKRYGSVR